MSGNTGSGSVAGGGTLTIQGGTSISTSVSGSTITINNSGVTSFNGATGAVTITNSGVTSITGTSNQVTASASTGGVTLSLPQSIATSSSPTFAGMTLSGLTGYMYANAAGAITASTTIPASAITGSIYGDGEMFKLIVVILLILILIKMSERNK